MIFLVVGVSRKTKIMIAFLSIKGRSVVFEETTRLYFFFFFANVLMLSRSR